MYKIGILLFFFIIGCKKESPKSNKLVAPKTEKKMGIDDIEWMTEEYPPYNFGDEKGVNQGIAVEYLKAMFKGSDKDIQLLPWARGYKLVQTKGKYNCLFSMTRTEERENLFKWFGPISNTQVYVEGPKNGKKINSKEELKNYTYSVIRGGISPIRLKTFGVPESNMNPVANIKQMYMMLKNKKVDFMAYEWNVINWSMKKLGFDPTKIEKKYLLKDGKLWFACNKSVSDEIIQKLQNIFNTIKNKEEVKTVLKSKYGL